MITTALLTLISATLIQHLGLAEAISKVITKITSCNQCFTFWLTLAALFYKGCDPIGAVVLSIFASYLSNWFILLLMYIQRLFTHLYDKEKDKS